MMLPGYGHSVQNVPANRTWPQYFHRSDRQERRAPVKAKSQSPWQRIPKHCKPLWLRCARRCVGHHLPNIGSLLLVGTGGAAPRSLSPTAGERVRPAVGLLPPQRRKRKIHCQRSLGTRCSFGRSTTPHRIRKWAYPPGERRSRRQLRHRSGHLLGSTGRACPSHPRAVGAWKLPSRGGRLWHDGLQTPPRPVQHSTSRCS
mmetsp:Transcript_52335/g.122958  ORF Transcript_52335/g.122958 Transcript_52335/m.122958 type:complete len:201 (-) Transcript_52335:274-876(-)